MSTSRMQDELFDLYEINARIVKRQKAAIKTLNQIMVDQLDRDESLEASETERVIKILTGEIDAEDST